MICVYPADCTDFSTNGNGTVEPTSALVTETLNGEYELQLVHPIDEAGKWQRLVEGCILRAPVPAATTPRVRFSAPGDASGTEIYRINTDFAGAETRKGTLNLRSGPGRNYKILAAYKNTLTVQVIAKTSSAWYEVTAPDGKHGYMDTTYLVYDHTEGSASEAVSSVVDERQLRDQPFRIYRIVPDLDKITVYARHVFYDLLDNMIKSYKPSSSAVGASVVQTVSSSCLSDHDFTFYSDLDSTAEDVEFENVNPVDAILGEDGVVEKYTGELTRDWWDVFVVKRVGQDTNVQIRQAKNLLGISYDIDLTDVVTRIMPTGEDADGNVLYLPELYIDSPLIDTYTHEIVKQFQDYSFVRSSNNDLYQLIFYNFATKFQKDEKAQFLTPLPIIDFIVKIVNPKSGETICDPCCGIADFLSKSYVNASMKLDDCQLYGFDNDYNMTVLAQLNMLLNGDGNAVIKYVPEYGTIDQKYTKDKRIVRLTSNMHHGGNWNHWYDETELMQYDVILTNPPFGKNRSLDLSNAHDLEVSKLYELYDLYTETNPKAGLDKGVVFLENAVRQIKENGRFAIVLSNAIMSNNTWTFARQWLMKQIRIVALFDLPENVFAETGVNTTILVGYKPSPEKLNQLIEDDYTVFTRDIAKVGYKKKTSKRTVKFDNDYALNPDTFETLTNEEGESVLNEDFTTIVHEFKDAFCGPRRPQLRFENGHRAVTERPACGANGHLIPGCDYNRKVLCCSFQQSI